MILQSIGVEYFLLKLHCQHFALASLLIFVYWSPCHTLNDLYNNDQSSNQEIHPYAPQSSVFGNSTKNISQNIDTKPITSKVKENRRIKSKPIQSSSTRKCVVVFDIDDTLCQRLQRGIESIPKVIKENPRECPCIVQVCEEFGFHYPHIFLPYLGILFDYLLQQGVRIAFFSAYTEERNLSVIPQLLKYLLGDEKYNELESNGQFAIYSEPDLRSGNYFKGEGEQVKDLRKVIWDNESLSDTILVDDCREYTAHDQQPFIVVQQLYIWDDSHNVVLNSIYYMLGLFKTYFESEKYKNLPLREALIQILPVNLSRTDLFGEWCHKYHPFVHNMIKIGLSAVQEHVPEAALYTMNRFSDRKNSIRPNASIFS